MTVIAACIAMAYGVYAGVDFERRRYPLAWGYLLLAGIWLIHAYRFSCGGY